MTPSHDRIVFLDTSRAMAMFLVVFALSYVLTAVNGRVSMAGYHFGSAPVPYNIIMFYANGILGTFGLLCISFFLKKPQRPIIVVATSLITVVGLHELFIAPYNILIGSKSYLFTVSGGTRHNCPLLPFPLDY